MESRLLFTEIRDGVEKVYMYDNPHYTMFLKIIRDMDYSKERRELLLKYFGMGFLFSADNISKKDTDIKKLLKAKKITLYSKYRSGICKHNYYGITHKGKS